MYLHLLIWLLERDKLSVYSFKYFPFLTFELFLSVKTSRLQMVCLLLPLTVLFLPKSSTEQTNLFWLINPGIHTLTDKIFSYFPREKKQFNVYLNASFWKSLHLFIKFLLCHLSLIQKVLLYLNNLYSKSFNDFIMRSKKRKKIMLLLKLLLLR